MVMGLASLVGGVVKDPTQEVTLKGLIERHFSTVREKPPLNSESYLRVSSFSSLCMREEVLASRGDHVRNEEISSDTNLIFAHGSGLHWALQNLVLPQLPDVLVGVWRCLRCGKRHGSEKVWVPRPVMCDSAACRRRKTQEDATFFYEELHFTDVELNIGGHPDGFLCLLGQETPGVLEVKSINPRNALLVKNVPMLDHVVQLQLYLWLTGLIWGKILYWNKGESGMKVLVEHTVVRDESTIQAIRAEILELRASLRDSERALPSRICKTEDCARAGKCPLVRSCFELDE
jgi:hypothetical protein